MLEIRIAGREILGRPRDMSRPKGLYVGREGFQGWQGLSSSRREALARAVEHGEHDVPVYLGSRVMTVDGWVIAPTDLELGHLSESFTGLLAAGRSRVEVDQLGETRFADGRVMVAECEDQGSRGRYRVATLQLQLVFADPRRYGETLTAPETGVAAEIQVFHRGNFPAYPVVEIPNAPSTYAITSPAGTFTVTGATAGGTHTVDIRRGRVFRNGVEMIDVGRGVLWTIPPGMPVTHTLSVPGLVRTVNTYV